MSRIVLVILIYHRHKPIDSINLLGSNPRKTSLARPSKSSKLQTQLLVRESAHINKPATFLR
jgi:hypothetical protein